MPVEEQVAEAVEKLESPLRRLGIYLDRHHLVGAPGRPLVVIQALLGDVAFTPRVQDPAQDSVDDAVREMDVEFTRSDFSSAQEEMRARLAAGLDPLGDDE